MRLHLAGCNISAAANTQVLIRVITLNSDDDLGHVFGAIGHILFKPLDWVDIMPKINLYREIFLLRLFCVFRLESLSYLIQVRCYTVTHKSPQKLSVLDVPIQISGEWEDFKCCFVQCMQNITQCLSLLV